MGTGGHITEKHRGNGTFRKRKDICFSPRLVLRDMKASKQNNKTLIYAAGTISIEHVTIFLSKYISKGAVDMTFSPDVGNDPSNPYMRSEVKLCVIM